MLSETGLARVRRWVDTQKERIGDHIDEMWVEVDVDQRALTILECQPALDDLEGAYWIR